MMKKILSLIFIFFFMGCATRLFNNRNPYSPYEVYFDPVHEPEGLTADPSGNLYVASERDGGIYQITPLKEKILFAADLNKPDGLVLDPQGNLYVSIETPEGSILKVTPDKKIETLIPNLHSPEGMVIDASNHLYFVEDNAEGRFIRFNLGSKTLEEVAIHLKRPENMAQGMGENFYITETLNNRVVQINSAGEIKALPYTFQHPDGICYSEKHQALFVAEDIKKGKIFAIQTHKPIQIIADSLRFPQGLSCNAKGDLYIAEKGHNRILKFNAHDIAAVLAG